MRKDTQVTHDKLLHYSYLPKPLESFLNIIPEKFYQVNIIEYIADHKFQPANQANTATPIFSNSYICFT